MVSRIFSVPTLFLFFLYALIKRVIPLTPHLLVSQVLTELLPCARTTAEDRRWEEPRLRAWSLHCTMSGQHSHTTQHTFHPWELCNAVDQSLMGPSRGSGKASVQEGHLNWDLKCEYQLTRQREKGRACDAHRKQVQRCGGWGKGGGERGGDREESLETQAAIRPRCFHETMLGRLTHILKKLGIYWRVLSREITWLCLHSGWCVESKLAENKIRVWETNSKPVTVTEDKKKKKKKSVTWTKVIAVK